MVPSTSAWGRSKHDRHTHRRLPAWPVRPIHGEPVTFTVLARDTRRGLIGVATASRSLAVGASVIGIDPHTGAVASQAWTNPALRGRALEAMRDGASAREALERVPSWDAEPELRQIAALGWTDEGAARSGGSISAWAGDRSVDDAVFAGNLLEGPGVIDAMTLAWEGSTWSDGPSFASTLVRTLAAGDAAGGDARGRQSAAVVVASRSAILLDLRVDDHAWPIPELDRLCALAAQNAPTTHSVAAGANLEAPTATAIPPTD